MDCWFLEYTVQEKIQTLRKSKEKILNHVDCWFLEYTVQEKIQTLRKSKEEI